MDKEKYFNYSTGPVNLLTGDVIDTSKTGMSFYDDLLPNGDPEYMRDKHNLVSHIEYMTPNEYYKQCSLYGFPGGVIPVEKLKQERRIDKKTLEHLKDVLTDYGHKFPIPFVNKAERGQEGLHRMMVLGDMFGWDKGKYPVLVITWADEDRAKRDKQARIDNDIRQDIKSGVQKALHFTYYNIEEFKEQLQYSLDSSFEFSDYVKPPVQFTLTDGKTWPDEDYAVTVNNVSYEFEKSSVKLKEPQPVDDDLNDVDIDIDDIELDELDDFEDTEDFLKRYFGDNWRETNPELKKTFGIKESYEKINFTYIKRGWSRETAHPTAQKYWTEDKPSLGQCAITALYLNEKYGYSIWETLINNRNRHFFNKDNDGNIIDLTKDQFSPGIKIDYENSRQRDPKQLLRSCNSRYQLFKKNLNNI